MHARVVEVIALHAPCVDEHLAQVLAHVDRISPRGQLELRFVEIGRRLGAGFDDVQIVVLAEQQLLAVARQLVQAHLVEELRRLGAVVRDLDRHQLRLGLRPHLARQPVERLVADRETAVVAGGHGHFVHTIHQPVVIDAHQLCRLRRFLLVGRFIALRIGLVRTPFRRALRISIVRRGRRRRLFQRILLRQLARLLRRCRPLSLLGRRDFLRLLFFVGRGLFLHLRMQLVRGLEGRAQSLAQGDLIDLVRLVEERFGLPRSPRCTDDRSQVAIRQEVDPLPVRAEHGIMAVGAIAGQRRMSALAAPPSIRL